MRPAGTWQCRAHTLERSTTYLKVFGGWHAGTHQSGLPGADIPLTINFRHVVHQYSLWTGHWSCIWLP